jgi:hypothetical protein
VSSSDSDFLTVREVAARLIVSVYTVHEWTRRRNTNPIPHYSINRKAVYFKWEEVVA